MPELYEVNRPCARTRQQLDDVSQQLAVVQTLTGVLDVAIINREIQPTLDDVHTYLLHLSACVAGCTQRLEALLDGKHMH